MATGSGDPHRSRLTGRALVLLMVLLVLAVSYGSSFKAYLRQRAEIADLRATIADRQAGIDALEREKERWEDPAFVRAQARQRFGYVMPGETSYVVLDEYGRPLEPQSELDDPADVGRREPTGWWNPLWESVELAGQPVRAKAPKPPADEIDGTEEGAE